MDTIYDQREIYSIQESLRNGILSIVKGTDSYAKLDSIDIILIKLNDLMKYEKSYRTDFYQNTRKLYIEFLKEKDVIIIEIIKSFHERLIMRLEKGITKKAFLRLLELIKNDLQNLETRTMRSECFRDIYKSMENSIRAILSLPDNHEVSSVCRFILGSMN